MKLVITEAQAAFIIKEGGGKVLNNLGQKASQAGDWFSRKAGEKALDVAGNPKVQGFMQNAAANQSGGPGGMSDVMADRFSHIDIERDAPNLHKFANSWKPAGNVDGVRNSVKPQVDPDAVVPPEIPKGKDMMLPLVSISVSVSV